MKETIAVHPQQGLQNARGEFQEVNTHNMRSPPARSSKEHPLMFTLVVSDIDVFVFVMDDMVVIDMAVLGAGAHDVNKETIKELKGKP